MKSHNGMRPQDILILLKILTIDREWQYRDLSGSLKISLSEVSESLNRSYMAGLIDEKRKRVYRKGFMEFIEFGLQYVFPQQPGTLVTGIPTAHSHSFFQKRLISNVNYVWEDGNGTMQGLGINPLFKSIPLAITNDSKLHLLLAAIDVIRVGKTRELKIALELLKNEIL